MASIRASQEELIGLGAAARHWAKMPVNKKTGFLAGVSRSQHKGRGLEFAEVRQYQPGDEIRSIDWRVSARKGKAHTKLFIEEREKPVLIYCDQSLSMAFGSKVQFKSALAARTASFIAWLAKEQGDKVGGIISNRLTHNEQKPAPRQAGVLRLINWLDQYQPRQLSDLSKDGSRNFNQDLLTLVELAKPGTRVFLISDFLNLPQGNNPSLGKIAKHCQISAIHITDPLETHLPAPGRYKISNGASEAVFNSGSNRIRQTYEKQFAAKQIQIRESFRALGQTYLQLSTAQTFSNYHSLLAELVSQ